MGLYNIEKIKIKEIIESTLSTCKKYKRTSIVSEDHPEDIIKLATKPETILKIGDPIQVFHIRYGREVLINLYGCIGESMEVVHEIFISLDDFDEWLCKEYGQIIDMFFFSYEIDNFDNKRIYAVTCIDGDTKKTAICLTETDAIAMFYSECIDRDIAYEFTHDNGSKYSYENDDEDRFVRIWIQELKINEWEEGL